MKSKYLAIASIVIALTGCGSGENGSDDNPNIEKNSELKSLSSLSNVTQNIQARKLGRSTSQSNIPIAWGFDYPIGNRGYDSNGNKVPIDEHISSTDINYNKDRNEEYNLGKNIYANNERGGTTTNGWYNLSDVGNFVWEDGWAYTGGLHPGEDWNKAEGDAGENVYAIAEGKVVYLKTTYPNTTDYGWTIVVEHTLPDKSKIYSIYTHITYDENNDNGIIATNANQFRYGKNDIVHKGNIIARVADKSSADHLHFEIRNEINLSDLYPNDNEHGYYSHDKSIIYKKNITEENVKKAFKLMKEDGILDPSDFIDDHRDIYPWVGNGSIISYHGENHNPNTEDSQYPFGITQDITRTHSQLNDVPNLFKQSGFFQWQVSSNCKNLKIDHSGINNNVDITIGNWNNRTNDITFKNVKLPFILGENNLGYGNELPNGYWKVIAVTFNNSTMNNSSYNDVYNTLSATCTDEPSTPLNSSTSNQHIMIGEHQWNGNASIISRIFESSKDDRYSGTDDWPYGVFQDVTMVHKNQYKPVVFFQWMSSDVCKELEIDADLTSDEKHITLGIKNWASNTYENKKVTLPYTIKKERLWSVIKVAFDKPVSKDARVNAYCKDWF